MQQIQATDKSIRRSKRLKKRAAKAGDRQDDQVSDKITALNFKDLEVSCKFVLHIKLL